MKWVSRLSFSLVLLAISACAKPTAKSTPTGDPSIDAFFDQVGKTEEIARGAEQKEIAARQSLMEALGLGPTADPEVAVFAVSKRASKLRDHGLLLHLNLTPKVELVAIRGSISLDSTSELVLRALELSARESVSVSRELNGVLSSTIELEKKRKVLLQNDALSSAIKERLASAEATLKEARERATLHGGRASKFVLALALGTETGAGGPLPSALPPEMVQEQSTPSEAEEPATTPAAKAPPQKPPQPKPSAPKTEQLAPPKTPTKPKPKATPPPPTSKPKSRDDFDP